jgi:hypothetical protein
LQAGLNPEGFKPSTDRCGGSAGSKSIDFFRFPLNCGTELRREHQRFDCMPPALPKSHCALVARQRHLRKTENSA